jgi:hypothetical protein
MLELGRAESGLTALATKPQIADDLPTRGCRTAKLMRLPKLQITGAFQSGVKGGRTRRWSLGKAAMLRQSSSSSLMESVIAVRGTPINAGLQVSAHELVKA